MQQVQQKPTEKKSRKSVVVVPSRMSKVEDDEEMEGVDETEIAAQITVPTDGGWGWVVVFCSFINFLILDGVVYTFGTLLNDICKDLKAPESQITLINSTEVATYFILGPIASALINRFGFRYIAMLGSVIMCLGLFASFFTNNFVTLLLCYGCFTGIGASFISMTSALIVGFYFENLRALAMAIVSSGTSIGIMVMFPLNNHLVKLAGWRATTLFHSGLHGLLYFFTLSFRPLPSMTITKTVDEGSPTRTVTYLPNMANTGRRESTASRADANRPTTTQRMLNAVSNAYFPTAAQIVHEGDGTQSDSGAAGSSGGPAGAVSRLTVTVQGAVSRRQLKQVQSMVSRPNMQDRGQQNVEITVHVQQPPKAKSCWGRLCQWETHTDEARPMYRDDAFYTGKIEKLPTYMKSTMEIPKDQRTGLEYQLAVTRAVTLNEMHERRGVFTTAVRRVLATMLDPTLLRRSSFLFYCASSFATNFGVLVPYIFLQERNLTHGIDPVHCKYFISVISFANLLGRLTLATLSAKVDPVLIVYIGLITAGVSTSLSNLSYSLGYQYAYSIVFGFSIAVSSALRSIILVSLYGLENLTNATGMVVLFIGVASLFGSPIAAALKEKFSDEVAFIVCGIFIAVGGLFAIPIRYFHKREMK